MITLYAEFITVLIITPIGATAVPCGNADKKRINDVELLKDKYIKNDNAKPKSRCCPYDFDSSLCKIVGDRLLCGYNRNIGGFQNDDSVEELGNGCRIRDGRVECGYVNGPYANQRRPPAADNVQNLYEEDNSLTTVNDEDKNGSDVVENDKKIEALKHVTSKGLFEHTTRCLEIKERVVCRHL